MSEKVFSVYMATCIPSGKCYIGITSQTVIRRWKRHCLDARKGNGFYFHSAIEKYGADQFRIELIATARSLRDAAELERASIAKHNSFGAGGYNLTKGGEGATGRKKTAKQRARSSQVAKDLWRNERPRMIEALKIGWSHENARNRLREALAKASARPDVKRRRCEAMSRRFSKPENLEKLKASSKERANRPEAVARQSDRMRQHWKDPLAVAKQVSSMKKAWADPSKKAKWRAALRDAWILRRARQVAIQMREAV